MAKKTKRKLSKEHLEKLHGPEAQAKKKLAVYKKRLNKAYGQLLEAGMSEVDVNGLFGVTSAGRDLVLKDEELQVVKTKALKALESTMVKTMISQAMGYEYDEVTTDYAKSPTGSSGPNGWIKTKRKVVKKHQAGNSSVLQFLMCNRFPDTWKVSKETVTKKEGYDSDPNKRARKQIESLASGLLEDNTDDGEREHPVQGGPARISDAGPEVDKEPIHRDVQGMSSDNIQDNVLDVPATA